MWLVKWFRIIWRKITGRQYFVGVDYVSDFTCHIYAYTDRRGVMHIYDEKIERQKHPAECVVERSVLWREKQIILNHTIVSLWGVPVTLVMDFDPRLPADMHSSVKGFYCSHKG